MIKRVVFLVVFFYFFSDLCAQTYKVEVSTNMGNMTFVLYDDTPLHRNAFLELARNGHFDNTLFYRVIENYIIQGGSRDSRNAPKGKFIGYGDPTKTVNDEILKHHVCKKGALCAPRQPDEVNIFKQSDISQFFVIQGRKYTHGQLDTMELAINRPIRNKIVQDVYTNEKKELFALLKEEQRFAEARQLADEVKGEIEYRYTMASGKMEFSPEQREAYTSVGGSPEIENEYTVFGEIISGMEVIDKIAALKTDKNNRPYTDVVIKVRVTNN
jgi:cyclophilin family peptidyl-prolyl cis-trans isomerase